MIDLNNTWCEATEENYNALIKLGKSLSGYDMTTELYFLIENGDLFRQKNQYGNRKQIRLVDGEFQYVETKPKNNFKDYGFEADFEGEIFKEGTILRNQKVYLATIKNGYEDLLVYFNEDGKCHQGKGYFMEEYNLKPIKKEWYENADNFPCIVMQINCIDDREIDCGHIIFRNIDDFNRFGGDYRHLIKEEVLALLVKE